MNKRILYICAALISVAASLSLTGCSKQEIPAWTGEDYVRIEGPEVWTLDTDSMEYSFASSVSSVKTFDAECKVVVEGARADVDRVVYLKVDDATTAESSFYSMPEYVTIPAGQGYGSFRITLNRDTKLQDRKYILQVSIDDGKSTIKTGVQAYKKLTIKFSDILSRPSNWADLEEFFGASYSDTKYRFIIDTVGTGDFTYLQTGGMSWGEMWNYRLLVVTALDEYNKQHPTSPLKDEFGSLVSFDN